MVIVFLLLTRPTTSANQTQGRDFGQTDVNSSDLQQWRPVPHRTQESRRLRSDGFMILRQKKRP
ncbi:hypothetical protein INR49_009528 [Caranx melampygus]|nr:hypothetical protein INR49_009528 [Caranx melampygus]